MRPQRDDKVVDTVGGVVSGQDDGFVLPLVLFGVPIATVFANLDETRDESDGSSECLGRYLLEQVVSNIGVSSLSVGNRALD